MRSKLHNHRSADKVLLTLITAAILATVPALADSPGGAGDEDATSQAQQTAKKAVEQTQQAIDETADQAHDAAITAKVESKLIADPEINPFDIDVNTDAGVVTLAGTVAEDNDRTEAERLARTIDGVVDVDNQIALDSSASQVAETSGSDAMDSSDSQKAGYADRDSDLDEALPQTASQLPLTLLLGLGSLVAAASLMLWRRS